MLLCKGLHGCADQEGAECHPVRYGPLVVPHLPAEILPEGPALLPRVDLRIARKDELLHKTMAGGC